MVKLFVFSFLFAVVGISASRAQVTAIRVGHLVDPEAGTVATNQTILVEAGKFSAIGAQVSIPAGAQIIDLSKAYVSPGLVDAHDHLALTYKWSRNTIAIT